MEWLDQLNGKQRAAANKVAAAADRYGVPRELALAAAKQESNFNQNAKSGTGPVGVMQMSRAASKDYNINPHNEDQNIDGGMRMLRDLLAKHNDPQKALIAYHDGPNSSYFKSGEMSPAAYNHLQKVKEYGGFTGEISPMSTAPQTSPSSPGSSMFKIATVAPVETVTFPTEDQGGEFFMRPRDINDVAGAAAGAGAGYFAGANKPISVKKQQIELSKQRLALAQQKEAQDLLNAGKTKTFGQDIGNWVPGQYREDIARSIHEPMSQADAAAQAAELEAKARTTQQKFGAVQQASPGSALVVPSNVGSGQKILPPTVSTPAPRPTARLEDMPAAKINAGRNIPGRALNTGTGALAGMQAADMYQRGMQGDVSGATLGGISAAGLAGATHLHNPKLQAISGAVGVGAGGLQQFWDYLRDHYDIAPKEESVLQNKAAGGILKKPEGEFADTGGLAHFAGGGLAKDAWKYGSKQAGKLSDWAQEYIGHYLVPTQADRMGGVGGPSYSANQLGRPEYANRAWGSGQQATATGIANLAKDPSFGGTQKQIFAPLLGSENMHQSNQIAFDALMRQFYKDPSKLTPEKRSLINEFMRTGGAEGRKAPYFDPISNFDIANRKQVKELGQTFDTRKAIAEHAFGGTGMGKTKAQLFDYQGTLDKLRDPHTMDAPTFAVGPRAFRLTGDIENTPRPDLNRAYPWQLHGEDLGVTYQPVPSELALMDFQRGWRGDTGNTAPLKSGALKQPGYYEHTLGYTPPGVSDRVYPRQEITEDWVKDLQRSGFKAGGLTHR